MKIQDIIQSIHSEIRPLEAFWTMIEIAANRLGEDLPVEKLRHGQLLRQDAIRILLEGAAELLMKEDRQARYDAIITFLDQNAAPNRFEQFWIRKDARELVTALIQDARKVRFSFPGAFRPWLAYAFDMADRSELVSVHFSTGSIELEHACCDLISVLDLSDVTVDARPPWDTDATGDADFEVMLPPFGMPVQDLEKVSAHMLSPLGAAPNRVGRLNVETLAILHALENHNGRAVILVPKGLLFRMVGAEAIVRRHLVESDRIRAVLDCPAFVAFNSNRVDFGLLVLSGTDDTQKMVRIVDMDHHDLRFWGLAGKLPGFRSKSDVVDLALGPAPSDKTIARDVSHEEMSEHNWVLTSDRYLNPGPKERIDVLLLKTEAVELQEIVEMTRPVSFRGMLGEDYTLHEASPGDVGRRGYLERPGRSISVDRATYNRALKQQVLPGDVLLSIKGTIGVVGLVPESVPKEGETEIWTAGQSLMILRPKKRGGIDPITLYEYLTDETVQEFIKSLTGGTAVQNLAMRDLKAFPVAVPSKEVMAAVRAQFEERQSLLDEIEAIERKIETQRAQQWPHAQLVRAA